jgi:hypothetical protein
MFESDAETKLRQAEQGLRDAIAEAHAMTKSLLAAIEGAKKIVPLVIQEQINSELVRQLAALEPEMSRQIEESRIEVIKSFSELQKSLVASCRIVTNSRLPLLPTIVTDMVQLVEIVADAEAKSADQLIQDMVEGKKSE